MRKISFGKVSNVVDGSVIDLAMSTLRRDEAVTLGVSLNVDGNGSTDALRLLGY